MPTVTITKAIAPEQAAEALKERLGSGYKVTAHTGRSRLTVSHEGVAFATVRLVPGGDVTTFHVHGRGLIVGRIVNELGIARTVTAAIKDSLGPADAG